MKYYGKFRGLVKDNKDPLKKGRIRVVVPEIASTEVLDWALPCIPYGATINPNTENQPAEDKGGFGYFSVPELDTGVWIEFEAGDINRPIWVGIYWSTPSTNGVPRDNVPSQALDKGDPDTDVLDYPKENTFKSERFRHTATRRIVLELDQDTVDTNPWDDRVKYKNPHIEIGRKYSTDESGKNIVDIATSSRDLRIDTERNRDTESEKDIIDYAHQNVHTEAGPERGLEQSTDVDIGNIDEFASNRINMEAIGDPTINSDPPFYREALTGDAPNAKLRMSGGLPFLDDMANSYDSNFNASNLTIKLTGQEFAKLESLLNDVIIRSRGADVYIKSAKDVYVETGRDFHAVNTNGFWVETNSSGVTPRAVQLHYKNAGMPSGGGPSHEFGKPTSFPQGSSKQFIRFIDERAIPSYNQHTHTVQIPEEQCECTCDCEGGGGSVGDVLIGDFNTYDYIGLDYDAVFPNGLLSQVQNIAGTTSTYIDPVDSKIGYSAIDVISTLVDNIVGWIAINFYSSDKTETMMNLTSSSYSGSLGIMNYDTFTGILAQDYLGTLGLDGIAKALKVNGPNFNEEMGDGVPASFKIRGVVPDHVDVPYHGSLFDDTQTLSKFDSLLMLSTERYGQSGLSNNPRIVLGTGRYSGLISLPINAARYNYFRQPYATKVTDFIMNPEPVFDNPKTELTGYLGEDGESYSALLGPGLGTITISTSTVEDPETWTTEQVDPAGIQQSSTSPRKVSTEYSRGN